MTPYYQDDLVTLYHGDAREAASVDGVVMTDPPYNVGYHYATYTDRLPEAEYLELLSLACRTPSVVIQYPEPMFAIAGAIGMPPTKTVAWVYNANTPKQWRTVAWFGIAPDLSLVRQPYKNPTDRRVAALIASGKEGPPVYDWWHIDQVKNVSEEKTGHPCQVPLDLMARIVAVTPAPVIIDPFSGSGTTLRAAKDAGRKAIGFEMDEAYCEMAAVRLSQEVLGLSA
jgi:DNA modification methylase